MIKRYDPCCSGWEGTIPEMERADDGDYVLYEDYDKALELLREISNIDRICLSISLWDRIEALLKEADHE